MIDFFRFKMPAVPFKYRSLPHAGEIVFKSGRIFS